MYDVLDSSHYDPAGTKGDLLNDLCSIFYITLAKQADSRLREQFLILIDTKDQCNQ